MAATNCPITYNPGKILGQINFQPNSPRQNFGQNNNASNLQFRQNFSDPSNANTHFQNKLPPPMLALHKQGIANAYHWVQTSTMDFPAGQLPSPNSAPPVGPSKGVKINTQLPTVSDTTKETRCLVF
ncbi:hypothetical protein AVEN_207811-1 [Araneus ventricosus]|uniref:Uncharacterized protein n=1 Tax=Araneus ventricosus TaxID=182803 RepID=A0A4Y2BWT8_ARAVE|nr:hypothetical protein AVEN_207811-1 [Araneus ventricosus]